MAARLLEMLPDQLSGIGGLNIKSALDVGCATGTVARELSSRFPAAHITALDISSAMLLRARENEGKGAGLVSYVACDFEALPFEAASFDLVLSNLSYQWADSLLAAFDELSRVLAPGGLVLINTLTHDTLKELKESIRGAEASLNKGDKRRLISFVEPEFLKEAIRGSGLELSSFDERTTIREYRDMWELLRVLKNIGAANPLPDDGASLASGSLLKEAEKNYKLSFPAVDTCGVRATYNTVFILARKAL